MNAPKDFETKELIAELASRNVYFATNFQKVRAWHEAFSVHVEDSPTTDIPDERKILRVTLMKEEFKELRKAIAENDIIEIADGIADLLVVTYGTAVEYGIDADVLFAEVHKSNMSKMGGDGKPIVRDDGKILKGPNFFKPRIKSVLRELGWGR